MKSICFGLVFIIVWDLGGVGGLLIGLVSLCPSQKDFAPIWIFTLGFPKELKYIYAHTHTCVCVCVRMYKNICIYIVLKLLKDMDFFQY